jgi:hypothetical protein
MALLLEIEKEIDTINKNKNKLEHKQEIKQCVILPNEKQIKEFIKNTTSTKAANKIIINFGHKKTEFLFDIKLSNNKQYDILPLVNSNLQEYIMEVLNTKITNIYLEDTIYQLENINFKNGEYVDYKNINYFKTSLVDYEMYDLICDDIEPNDKKLSMCIKSINRTHLNRNMFSGMLNYNYKDTYNLLQWKLKNDIHLNLKLYKKYYVFEIEVSVNEYNEIPLVKMETITEVYKKIETIIKFLEK